MKYKNILPFVALSALALTSCDDNKMEWYKDPTHGAVTSSELPLQLAEKISRYEPLKAYLSDPNFKLGIGVGMDEYLGDETTTTIVNENFNDLTIGYAMKHAPMVDSKGNLKFDKVDQLFAKTLEAGVSIYGHCLVWHSNQNASYLNSLIAPEVIPAPAGSNLVDLSGIEDGSFGGWELKNGADAMSIVVGEGLTSTSKALKFEVGSSVSNPYSIQLFTPDITVISGHDYEISFFVRSEQPGKARLSFDGLENNNPWKDWYATGSETEAFETTSQWKQVKITVNDFVETTFKFAFEFGYLPNVTYYVDNILVIDKDAEPSIVNLIANGNFDDNLDGWSKYNGPTGCNTHVTGAEAYQGNGAMKVINDAEHLDGNNQPEQWRVQMHADFTETLTEGQVYIISYYIRSDVPGSVRCSTTGGDHYQGDQETSTTWTFVEWEINSKGLETGLNFDLGWKPATYYIDNVLVTQKAPVTRSIITRASGPTIIEKTDEEKEEIIKKAMKSWISQMVTHCKNNVHAWDVVNEPMDDGKPSSIKSGKYKTDLASDEFYWQDYFLTPKDYALEAFKLARKCGNANDKLFINDYNLEYSLAKCDGLIEYVKYIESKGATVDGIGTQMHIAIDSNKDNIAQMFQKLAATGKLIKVSELDIKVNTSSPTTENLAQQAEMYQYVIDMYKKYIPLNQQYGITIWGVSDNEKEHVNWIPDDAPNLWDANYARKHAYKGVADGLAGKDVSEGFTGDLQ